MFLVRGKKISKHSIGQGFIRISKQGIDGLLAGTYTPEELWSWTYAYICDINMHCTSKVSGLESSN